MATIEEVSQWKKIQNRINEDSKDIGLKIELIKKAKGKDNNRAGLHNVGIILNNKLATEIVRVFYEHGIYDLNNDRVFNAVLSYLEGLKSKAVDELNQYVNENLYVADDYSRIRFPFHQGLKRYNEVTEQVFDFDLVDDFFAALTEYTLKYISVQRVVAPTGLEARVKDLELSLFDTLEKLGLGALYEPAVKQVHNLLLFDIANHSGDGTYLEKTK